MTGLHIAQYRIDAELGRGGMGIVYRATDTKLDRTVALKVLPPHALASGEDRARFYREAKAAAQLNHPHIATIHQIDEAVPSDAPHGTEPRPFIAMEFVDGESLADRISKGPLKLDETVRITRQTAEALAAAHEAGIVHRDVKSGNVMLTAKGAVKVLDFGLAKTAASTQLTRQGSTLGTIAYMSPEQARGEEVDRRTDLWALGVVMYEMIAGRLPFAADYEQATLYAILNEDPEPLTAVRTGVPPELERIVDKLMAKTPDIRYQGAAGLIADLKAFETGASRRTLTGVGPTMPAAPPVSRTSPWVWPALVVALVAGAAAAWIARSPEPPAPRIIDFPVPGITAASLSHAGASYAYVVRDTLYARDFSESAPRRIGAAPGAQFLTWSPDDSQIAWAQGSDIWRASTVGGRIERVFSYDAGTAYGLAWRTRGDLLIAVRSGTGIGQILSVPATGGRFEVYRDGVLASEMRSFESLAYLPEEDALFAVVLGPEAQATLARIDDHEGDIILSAAPTLRVTDIAIGPSRILMTASGDGLWGFPLSEDLRSVDGPQERIAPAGAVQPSEAADGTLMYLQTKWVEYQFRWLENDGTLGAGFGRSSWYIGNPVLHPDEDRVLAAVDRQGMWILGDRGSKTPVDTGYEGIEEAYAWLPDGRRAAIASFRSRDPGIFIADVTGVNPPQRLGVGGNGQWSISISASGERMAWYTISSTTMRDLYWVDIEIRPDSVLLLSERQEYLATATDEASPVIHPGGDWLAYQTNASGRWEIVVRSFPDPDRDVIPITSEGGTLPRWSPDGRLLYYQGADGYLWRVPFDAEASRAAGTHERLIGLPTYRIHTPYEALYAVGPTTGRVAVTTAVGAPPPPSLTTIEHWAAQR